MKQNDHVETVDAERRSLLVKSLPVLLTTGCLGMFGRDDTVEVSNENDEKQAVTIRFVDETTNTVVSERKMTLRPGAEKQYKVHLAKAGHESSHYVVTVTTESGLRKTHDMGEGVFYILYVTVESDGIDFLRTIQ